MARSREWTLEAVLTPGQIARACHVDPRTVYRWIDHDLLESHELPITRYRRVRIKDFLKFLNAQKMPVPESFRGLQWREILVVDDDPLVVDFLVCTLKALQQPNLRVRTAEDGFHAGRLVEKYRPSLIILDLKMPRMNGWQLCRSLKSSPESASTRIIVLSAFMDEADRIQLRESGVDCVLQKPVQRQELLARVRTALDIKREAA